MHIFHHPNREEIHSEALKIRKDFLYILALIGPIMTIPQAFLIWSTQSSVGVSLMSWGTYLLLSVFWLFHGLKIQDKLLIINNIFGIIVNIFVVAGVLAFR
jgi:uncharacterized protein with PQ loop repeat